MKETIQSESTNEHDIALEKLSHSLENFSYINDLDRADILLTFEGNKPATSKIFWYLPDFPERYENIKTDEDLERIAKEFAEILDEAGLQYILQISDTFNQVKIRQAEFSISNNKVNAMALARASEEKNDREFGLLIGYPATAVDGFVNNKPRIEHKDLPEDVQSSEYFHFLGFALSKDHWQEEIETVKRQADIIQKVDPELYRRIVSGPILSRKR